MPAFSKQLMAACAVCVVGTHGLSLNKLRNANVTGCECLNWRDVYASGQVCGRGLELVNPTMTDIFGPWITNTAAEYLYKIFFQYTSYKDQGVFDKYPICQDMYEKLDSAMCVKANPMGSIWVENVTGSGPWYDNSWCYVDADKCAPMEGRTAKIPGSTGLRVKFCDYRENDFVLEAATPKDLVLYAKGHSIPLPTLTMAAYPIVDTPRFENGTDAGIILPGLERLDRGAIIRRASGDFLVRDANNSIFSFDARPTPAGMRWTLNFEQSL